MRPNFVVTAVSSPLFDLAVRCIKALALNPDAAFITISLPGPWKAPPGFPRRRLASINRKGTRNYFIDAHRLMLWLTKNGLVYVKPPAPQQGKEE